jgi:hypothetical protein
MSISPDWRRHRRVSPVGERHAVLHDPPLPRWRDETSAQDSPSVARRPPAACCGPSSAVRLRLSGAPGRRSGCRLRRRATRTTRGSRRSCVSAGARRRRASCHSWPRGGRGRLRRRNDPTGQRWRRQSNRLVALRSATATTLSAYTVTGSSGGGTQTTSREPGVNVAPPARLRQGS